MTSPVPLRSYHQHSSLGDYTDSDTIAPSKSTGTGQSYGDEGYDPYFDAPSGQGGSWSHTAFTDSDIHKPSLSYNSKELGK